MARQDEKDTAMEGLLRRSFAADARRGISSGAAEGAEKECPPAETLAAYYDRALSEAEQARYESHLSTCGLCRQQLVALVRADESATQGATEKRERGWSWFTNQWWLVPVAGTLLIAAVVYIGFAPRLRKLASGPAAEVAVSKRAADADTSIVPPPPVTKAAPEAERLADNLERLKAQAEGTKREKVEGKKAASRIPPTTRYVAPPTPRNAARAAAARAATTNRMATTTGRAGGYGTGGGYAAGAGGASAKTAVPAEPNQPAADQVVTQSQVVGVTAAAPPAAPAAQGGANPDRAQYAAPQPSDVQEVQETNSDVNKQDAKSAQDLPRSRAAAGGANQPTSRVLAQNGKEEGAAGEPSAAPKPKVARQKAALTAPTNAALTEARSNTKIISSPDSQSQWRIAEGGFVEHTENGGSTWTGVEPAPDAELTAGSAPAARTCWFVGRNGMILVTTDAVHWKIVTPPAQTDFTDVTATTGREATVTAADGRKFSTRNVGKTWQAVP
jgi:hypothetical protein